jgi:chaperone LolA
VAIVEIFKSPQPPFSKGEHFSIFSINKGQFMRFSIFAVLLAAMPSFSMADEVLNKFLNELQTLHASFEQKQFNDKGKLLESSQGEVYLQRPGKFRWDYQKPYQQLIVADGKQVWVYDDDLEQVTIKPLDEALGKTPALLLTKNSNKIENDFAVTNMPQQDANLTVFMLKPKGKQVQFESIRITLQQQNLNMMELVDNLGQMTRIQFKPITTNKPLDVKLFTFTPPAGTDVVEEEKE